ncbi:hypothetical protein FOZ62_009826 [Perkinsus olseni]|uniref:Immunoglobulin super DCC subclass member n=1 Tax=Perkinsus olseni TaxID=32597 RepID=A0A7J6U2I2_PEROL|nr:hypothetical protein FOZ62_009826 [Perkinsus olseni]
MHNIVVILCFMCLGGTTLDIKIRRSSDGYSKSEAQLDTLSVNGMPIDLANGTKSHQEDLDAVVVNSGRGHIYERPIGDKCYNDQGFLGGCICYTNLALSLPDKQGLIGAIASIVCTKKCKNVGECPKPPVGSAECLYGDCLISCNKNEDCPTSAHCEYFAEYDPKGYACVFAQ